MIIQGMGAKKAFLANQVIEAPNQNNMGYTDPDKAINGVFGGGSGSGSLDIYSIGNQSNAHHLVLSWNGASFTNGVGADLIIFENAFSSAHGHHFVEAGIVQVSTDGRKWATFVYDYTHLIETNYSSQVDDWQGFCGVQVVYLNELTHPIYAFDSSAGGDRFDLDQLIPSPESSNVLENGYSYVRIINASFITNSDTGRTFPKSFVGDPDIDGVYARYKGSSKK